MKPTTKRMDEIGCPCILWPKAVNSKGYGVKYVPKQSSSHMTWGNRYAHEVAWVEANNRPRPSGMRVAHSCGVKSCVNPLHLFLESVSASAARAGRARWRKA